MPGYRMRPQRFRIFALLVLLGLAALLSAQRREQGQSSPSSAAQVPAPTASAVIGPLSMIHPLAPDHAFPNGETYTYTAEWRIWTAGTVKLGISSDSSGQRVHGSADSLGVVSVLYPVHDRFDAIFD